MKEEMDDIARMWKAARPNAQSNIPSIDSIIAKAEANKRSALNTQYGNMAIMKAVLVVVAFFLYYLYPVPSPLSIWGTHLMVAGLAVRIVIELFSVLQSTKIDVTDTAIKAAEAAVKLRKHRNTINGPVTIVIVVLYSAGFFMWTQGLGKYVDWLWLLLLDGIYIMGAVVLIWAIKKGIRKEMDDLAELIRLKKEMIKEI